MRHSATRVVREMATRTEFLIHDLKFRELSEQLPVNVFPMSVKLTLARTEKRDVHMTTATDEPIRERAWPVPVKTSEPSPYINPTTVHIANPARDFDVSQKIWRFEEFVHRMTAAKEAIANQYPGDDERLYLNAIKVCEIPPEYAYLEDEDGNKISDDEGVVGFGQRAIDRAIYDDRAEMYIGHFTKRPTIADENVREQLGERAPGDVLQPLRLKRVKRVYAKNHRNANTCRKYFSKGQAEKYQVPNLAPREFDADTEAYTQTALREHFSALVESPFLDVVRFDGHYSTDERFVPENARVLERVREVNT